MGSAESRARWSLRGALSRPVRPHASNGPQLRRMQWRRSSRRVFAGRSLTFAEARGGQRRPMNATGWMESRAHGLVRVCDPARPGPRATGRTNSRGPRTRLGVRTRGALRTRLGIRTRRATDSTWRTNSRGLRTRPGLRTRRPTDSTWRRTRGAYGLERAYEPAGSLNSRGPGSSTRRAHPSRPVCWVPRRNRPDTAPGPLLQPTQEPPSPDWSRGVVAEPRKRRHVTDRDTGDGIRPLLLGSSTGRGIWMMRTTSEDDGVRRAPPWECRVCPAVPVRFLPSSGRSSRSPKRWPAE